MSADDLKEVIIKKKMGPVPVPEKYKEKQDTNTLGFWRTILEEVKNISKIKALGFGIERHAGQSTADQRKAFSQAELNFAQAERQRTETAILLEELRTKQLANELEERKLESIERLNQAIAMLRIQGGDLIINEAEILHLLQKRGELDLKKDK